MVRYVHVEPPVDPNQLAEFLSRELQELETALTPDEWVYPPLLNGFVNWSVTTPSTENANVSYRKDETGVVYIRGVCSVSATASDSVDLVFQLPEGYRPGHSSSTPQSAMSEGGDVEPNTFYRCRVLNDGMVKLAGFSGGDINRWASVNPPPFLAER